MVARSSFFLCPQVPKATKAAAITMRMKRILNKRYETLAVSRSMNASKFDQEESSSSSSSSSSMGIEAVDMNMRAAVVAVEEILHHCFKDKTLLQDALTHSSYTQSNSYQRLEFVGDAVLGLILAQIVFRDYPDLDPGHLSRVRAANISTEKLARVAVRHELYRYVRHNAPPLQSKVSEFVLAVQEEDEPVPYCGSVKAPKVLADIVESVAAAIYIDCNYDTKALWKILKRLFDPIITLETLHRQPQPVTMLYEFCQKQGKQVDVKHWRNGSKNIASVYVDGQLTGSGSSEQKEISRVNAAKEAMEKLWKLEHLTKTDVGNGAEKTEGAKQKLNEICVKNRWHPAKYSIKSEEGPSHNKRFICSVEVETADRIYISTGDIRSRVKDAENSAASMFLSQLQG